MPTTAFVQLARSGDLVSLLPVMRDKANQGRDVFCIVHPDFAPILEAVSYVHPVLRDTTHRDVEGAIKQAEKYGYDEILVTQVASNPTPPPPGCANFIQEQWARAGYLDKFHDLPLVFDKRDTAAEAKIIQKYLARRNAKPLLVYSLTGNSSPFHEWKRFDIWVRGTFGYEFDLLNLTELKLDKPQLLLPLIEAADVCLFSDSLPLHLAYAFCKPVFVLSRSTPSEPGSKPASWWWSERRRNWIGHMTYDRTETLDGRHEIALAISERGKWPDVHPPMSEADASRKIIHVVDWYQPATKDETRRNLVAFNKWEAIGHADANWQTVYFEANRHAKRTSKDLGDTRCLPYIKDVLDWAMEKARPDEIVCLTNADSCLVSDVAIALRRVMATADACFSRRVQVSDGTVEATQKELGMLPADGGVDLIAFKPKWWRENCHLFPDFLIGGDAWDCVFSRIIRNMGGREVRPPLVIHENHQPFWRRSENIETNPTQRHNRYLFRCWAVANGLPPVI